MEEARSTFEDSWQGQFDGAEKTPPPHLWVAIDGALANEEISTYKKKTKIYQWVAAACLLLLSLGGVYYNLGPSSGAQEDTAMTEKVATETPTHEEMVAAQETTPSSVAPSVSTIEALPRDNNNPIQNRSVLVVTDEEEEGVNPNYEVLSQQRLWLEQNPLVMVESKEPEADQYASNEKMEQIYGVPDLKAVNDLKSDHADLWAGVSFSAGAFNPGFNSGSSSADMQSDSPANVLTGGNFNRSGNQELVGESPNSYNTGSAISGGLAVGTRVNKFLVVSSGLQYNAYTSPGQNIAVFQETTQELVTVDAPNFYNQGEGVLSVGEDSYYVNNVQTYQDEIDVTNEYQYLTVPIKAGIILLDQKFNIILNTGVASNFLLNSSLEAKELGTETDTDNLYKDVYFNFLSSVEFGYNFNEKYLISVEPNYNQAISEFTNDNNVSQAKPKNFGVSLGVKYNF